MPPEDAPMPFEPALENGLCSVCGFQLIDGCKNARGGGGNIVTATVEGETLVRLCPNMKKVSIKEYLRSIEPRMASADIPHNRHSPLFQPGELDLTTTNLFFRRTDWNAFLSNLKWVAAYKFKRGLFIRIVTDLHLINVYVGNAALKSRLKSQQEEGGSLEICNSLPDLLEPPDLVIIRLGVLTHSNKAAANVLAEALLIRSSRAKPTWVVEPANKAFVPYNRTEYGTAVGMPSCNEEVLEYLESTFDQLHLDAVEGVSTAVDEAIEMTAELPDEMDAEMGQAALEEEPLKEEGFDDISDLDMEAFTGLSKKKSKFKPKKRGFGQ